MLLQLLLLLCCTTSLIDAQAVTKCTDPVLDMPAALLPVVSEYVPISFVKGPTYTDVRCPKGSRFVYVNDAKKLITADWYMRCGAETGFLWFTRSDSSAQNGGYSNTPIGCVKDKCATPLLDMPAALVPAGTDYVPIDFVRTETFIEVRCPKDATFAYSNGTAVKTADWYMRCDASTGLLWRTRSDSSGQNGGYSNTPIGCVKDKCLRPVLDMPIALLSSGSKYVPINFVKQPTYTDARCPSGSQFVYVNDKNKLVAAPWYMRCGAETGYLWRTRGDKSTQNGGYSLTPIGCAAEKCLQPALTMPAALLPAGTKYVEFDVVHAPAYTDLRCPAGAQFAYVNGENKLITADWYMRCGADSGYLWRTRSDSSNQNGGYSLTPIGCTKKA